MWQELWVIFLHIAVRVAEAAPANKSNGNVTTAATVNCTATEDRLNLNCINKDLEKLQSSLPQLFLVTAVSGVWVIYLTFFHSRLIGLIVTKIVNQFYKDEYFHIGSLSFSLLSGKIMFRDMLYVTVDNSLRLQDGYIIFRWWRPYNFTTWIKQKDLNQGHTRLSVYISHVEFHQYNRTSEYDRINNIKNGKPQTPVKTKPKAATKPAPWRSLFPVIKFTIASGKFMFGNRLLPYTLVAAFDDGDIQYKTTEASNLSDIFMHVVEGNLSDVQVKLTPSTDFDPAVTPAMLRITKVHSQPPPRKMGNGFVMVEGSNVNVKYLWDEPGLVAEGSEKENLQPDHPLWEMHIRCGKRISLNYGPWADRQRELLWKFFFPPDYQKLKVNKALKPGELRVVEKFFFSTNFLHDTNINIYFTEQTKVSALLINSVKGSWFDVDIPMLVQPDGYSTKIAGQLLFMQATTTQPYPHLLKAETLTFNVKAQYPLHWNSVQTWSCEITSTKATCTLLFAHKDFLANLMDDWAQKVSPDLMSFVPYTFAFTVKLQEFELVLPSNAHNWIDCSTRASENAFVALYGKQLDVDFTLPFDDFLPPTCSIPFKLDLQNGELAIYLPESNPSRNVLFNLSSNLHKWNDLKTHEKPSKEFCDNRKCSDLETSLSKQGNWGLMNSDEWVKCWQVAALQVVITYTWHPVYISKTPTDYPKESNLKRLSSGPSHTGSVDSITKKSVASKQRTKTGVTFDPTTLEADEIRVDLLMAPGSTLYLYGSLLDLLIMVKENYFGYDDVYTDFWSGVNKPEVGDAKDVAIETENLLNFRPLQVTLDINLSDINGILPTHPTPVLQSPPRVKLQKLTFEMDKNYHQTRLQVSSVQLVSTALADLKTSQATGTTVCGANTTNGSNPKPDETSSAKKTFSMQLLLSKLDVHLSDCLLRPTVGGIPFSEGHVVLHDLQLRGHAMFSGNGLPIGATLIEYAWLTEVLVGPVEGRVSIPQSQALANWAQTFVYLLKNDEHKLNPAFPGRTLPTGITWEYRKKDGGTVDETDVKYLMSRIRIDDVHLQVAEGSTLLDVTVAPVMVANGNVQERGVLEAVSAVVEDIQVRQRVRINDKVDEWLDAGEIGLGPLIAQVTMATDEYKLNDLQEDFLKFHDRKTRRLDFLWESADEAMTRRTSSGMTSLLDGVRSMKSWGCSFFTPLTTKHPTFFYDQQQQKMKKHVTTSHYVSAVDDVVDAVGESFDDEDVFDSGRDFGMSLLVHGRKLLARSWNQTSDRVDGKSSPEQPSTQPRPLSLNVDRISNLPAGPLLMAGLDEEQRSQGSSAKLVKMKKSSSAERYKRSTESNLYCSAESDFKSTSSISSGAYFSAESDVDEDGDSSSSSSSEKIESPVKRKDNLLAVDVDGVVASRPDVLEITPDTQLAADEVLLKTPPGRRFSVKKQALSSCETLMRCYERILPSCKALPSGDDVTSPVIRFSELTQGVHASVIVKEGGESTTHRRYSVDVLNQTDEEKFNSTNINLHVKDSVNVQISPFLLDSLHQIVEAAQSMVAWQHPLNVLCDLQEKCVSDAVTSHKVMTSVKAEDSPVEDKDSVKPGFQIQVCVDSLCVNVVQATLGEDPVFNLHINKLLPVPAMSILSTRLDQIDIHFELNSKHNKLLSKILTKQRKISSASSKSNESKARSSGRPSETNDESGDVAVFDFIGHVSVDSLALQLRVLSEDGKLPERTSMISIPDNSCRSMFHFDDDVILPDVRASVDSFDAMSSPLKKRQPPPKPWGWVTIEAGCRTVVANIVKQVGDGRMERRESSVKAPAPTHDTETAHVRFEESCMLTVDSGKSAAEDHVTNGVLNVDLVWLNVVSPLSPSQALKRSRSCRTWNLLTSIAPSVTSWLDPLDCLLGSLERFEKQRQTRKFAALNGSLVMALERAVNDHEVGKKLWDAKKHKFNAMSDLSNSIRQDASFKLCDALQRFLCDGEDLKLLEESLDDHPALVTLETGFQSVMAQWSELTGKVLIENVRKSRKKASSVSEYQNNGRNVNKPGIKFGGELELSTFVDPNSSQPTKTVNDSGKQPLLTPEANRRRDQTQTPTAAQELVYKQQQSMYSWMQNSDVEAQRGSFVEARNNAEVPHNSTLFNFKAVDLTPESIPASQEKFDHLMKHAGLQGREDGESSSNAIQSLCSGSLMIKANLKSLRIDKQNPDKLYTREATFQKSKRDRTSRRKSYAKADLPILLFQGFQFNASIVDTTITETTDGNAASDGEVTKRKGGNSNNSNSNPLQPSTVRNESLKTRSTLRVHIESSLKQATQKVDIDLIRLVHQFVQCSDAIQQAKMNIEVNKYTEGSTSPDPMSIHRRTPSNITNASGFSAPLERPTLHRRHYSQTSGIVRFHSVQSDTSSSSTESETLARAWQIFYRLIDLQNSVTGSSVFRSAIRDEFEVESDRPRGLSNAARQALMPYTNPYLSMIASVSFQIRKVSLMAEFGDLKLSVLWSDLQVSVSHTQTALNPYKKEAKSILRGKLAKIQGDVTEHLPGLKKTVITCEVASSNLDASTNHMRDSCDGNTCSLRVGRILIDLPQHPASLHDVVSRGTQNFSSHLLEFSRTPTYKMSFDVVDGLPVETPSATTLPPLTPMTPSAITAIIDLSQESSEVNDVPVVLVAEASLEGVCATVNLLPSLRVTYVTKAIEGGGRTGPDANFSLILSDHDFLFMSEMADDAGVIPVPTKIQLPAIKAGGELKNHRRSQSDLTKGEGELREGDYMMINVSVGTFDHSLTTDLFNQLVFFHEVFMQEVNDVITKVSRGDKPTSIRSETSIQSSETNRGQSFLYELEVYLERICLTATTPSGNAVRLKTGRIEFQLSNRVLRSSAGKKLENLSKYLKMFGKAQVDLTLSLGTLQVNNVYPEAEPEFHQMAYFTTRLGLQNTSQHGKPTTRLSPRTRQDVVQDNNVVLISLDRPIFFVQPTAFDKAILIFLAYKHAYEEWTEKRVGSEGFRQATRNVVSAIQRNKPTTSVVGNLFLQLSVRDLGICLPTVSDVGKYELTAQGELSSALVLTVENTLISACYDRSLVTRGQFKNFCVRFADDFQTSWDDWSPKPVELNQGPGSKGYVIMNSFGVPDGTYEICTDTTSHQENASVTARTSANVRWQMKGIDVELDTKIGAYLARLIDTLTLITGQDGNLSRDSTASDKLHLGSLTDVDMTSAHDVIDGASPRYDKRSPGVGSEGTPPRSWTFKERTKKLEQEVNEQVRIVNDLKTLGAKPSLILEQEKQLQTLEASLSSVFRQTVRNRLRRSSTKNHGEALKPTHQRSLSHGMDANRLPTPKIARSAFATLPPGNYRERFWNERNSPQVSSSHVDTPGSDEAKQDPFVTDDDSSQSGSDLDEVDGIRNVRRPLYQEDGIGSSQRTSFLYTSQAGGNELDADLELVLDVRVEIDGGMIVCHPMTSPHIQAGTYAKQGASRLPLNKTTTFFVPGVDVKLHYNSHNSAAGEKRMQEFFTPPGSPRISRDIPDIEINTPGGGQAPSSASSSGSKRACVYARFLLQSLPEMTISPFLLDFLEQTLSVIPEFGPPPEKGGASFSDEEEDTDEVDAGSEGPGAVEVFNTTMASLPVDVVVSVQVQPSQVLFNCQPMSRVECLLHIPSLELVFSSIRDTASSSQFAFLEKTEIPSGLSFTAVISDFSIYVFHQYDAQQTLDEFEPGSGRKDSLSVNLQLVKVNIVRTRKGTHPVAVETGGGVGGKVGEKSSLLVNLSVLADIDNASFKYDMRRLSEILAFPRAWYRKSIARRLFFGDTNNEPVQQRSGTLSSDRSDKSTTRRPLTPKSSHQSGRSDAKASGKFSDWRGVILFGVNMTRLDVVMNMSNVMGNTVWSCTGLQSSGKLSIKSSGEKEIHLSCGLENSRLTAKSGIIGGDIELRSLQANCNLIDTDESEPHHNVCVKMNSIDGRIEYMGTCIMMGRLTGACLKLRDEWKVAPNKRSVSVFVPGDIGWNGFYLIISRSTTPEVIKMLSKLEEFFTQQFHNSVRALTSWGQTSHSDVTFRRATVSAVQADVFAHHRHWPPAYTAIAHSPQDGAPQYHLGGSLCLHGNELTVVCFHGANFRSKSWVLFNLLEPNIVFSTEVQEIRESVAGNESSTLAIQSLTFNLSHDYWLKTGGPSSDPMATVSRVTRAGHQNCPPSAAPLEEWFAYVTASRSQELNMLRTLNDMNQRDGGRDSPNSRRVSNSAQSNYNHGTEIIFALPKLQLDFKTEHMQGPKEPDPNETSNRPIVECSFVTEFTDHICVTMDVELIMFLHDLISSYLKEKQQALSSRSRLSSVGAHSSAHPDHVTPSVDPIDLRTFVCNTWQLEPTVRLISWAGRRIEPVGVDYILQKLGFKHARTTIPKWIQRGVLDVLDQTLAVIVQNLVVQINNQKHKK